MEENRKINVDMTIKKKKNPVVMGVLVAALIGVIGYSSFAVYNYVKDNVTVPVEEEKELSGYLGTYSTLPEDASDELKEYVTKNYNEKGAYLYQDKKNTYLIISAGKIEDKTAYTISVESPVIDEENSTAKIVYAFVPYAADEHQKDLEPEIMVLKMEKLKDVTAIEVSNSIIIE